MAQINHSKRETTTPAMVVVVLGALIVALLIRFSFTAKPFDADGALFVYMGKLVDEGGRFGTDLIDNKPPTVGLMTSIAWRVVGDNWRGYVLTSALMSVIASLAIARAVDWARPGRFIATLAMSLVLLNIHPFVFGGFQTETLQMTFAALACAMGVAAIARYDWRDALGAGLCVGCAAMFKPSGLAIFAALAISFLVTFRLRSAILLASMTAGTLLVVAANVIYLDVSGSNGYYVAQTREAAQYAANSAVDAFALFKLATVLGGIFILIALATLLGRRSASRSASLVAKADCFRSIVLLGILWLAIEAIGIAMQRRMYAYHFLPLFAPASLLVALLPVTLPARSVVLVSLLPLALSSDQTRAMYLHKPDNRLALSDHLARNAQPNDRVWSDGYARLLIETNLKPGSKVPLTFLFINDDEAPRRYAKMLLDDLKMNNTRYVVLPHDIGQIVDYHIAHNRELAAFNVRRQNYQWAWNQIEQTIERDYLFQTRIDGLDVFVRRPGELEMDRADLSDTPH